jgi:hypothetical protein
METSSAILSGFPNQSLTDEAIAARFDQRRLEKESLAGCARDRDIICLNTLMTLPRVATLSNICTEGIMHPAET